MYVHFIPRKEIDECIKKANAEALWPEEDREELRMRGTSSLNLATETFWTKHIPAAENHPKFDLTEMMKNQAVAAYNEGWKAAIGWDIEVESFDEIVYDCRFPEKVKDPVLDVVYELPKDWKQYWHRMGYIAAENWK